MFREDKATALAAFFLKKAEGVNVDRFDLLKLMYAAERACLNEFAVPIVGDSYFNMEMGPVMSSTYDCIKGNEEATVWNQAIVRDGNYFAKLKDSPIIPDSLNEDEIQLAESAWSKYSCILKMGLREKSDYMHKEFPEWAHPGKYRRTCLEIQEILHDGFGVDEETAASRQSAIQSFSSIMLFASHHG